ncbi:Ca2+-binding EF-hand superfamily protein [Stackebrandtia albiflava]|uniref:Ca2+-binding EF-hand superfamily protein n=1 Tax=Stackebrandtia albiflava TaxID=406432 RepID=A0A562V448_9ACTN|nr:EF-hand domain-containing protein [Stackebrandtia albiflava]TWJ12602.1 Ca2+-binding EF-hand superfamily protein [Stackebrandtia albiflava]
MDLLDRKFAVCFSHLDADRNGAVERSDIDRLAERLPARFGVPADAPQARAYRDGLIRFWEAVSSECDTDADGRITAEEYIRGMRAAIANPAKLEDGFRAMAEASVRLIDTDGDDRISREEFIGSGDAFGVRRDEAEESFRLLDTDRDGHITTDELREAISQYYTGTDPDAPGNFLFGRAWESVAA